MNESFYNLPRGKQDTIINAALRVFAKYDYKKATTDEIVKEAGISKGLLFHYFENKKGLYLFLYDYSVRFIREEMMWHMMQHMDNRETDFFEILKQSQIQKCETIKRHPFLYAFVMKIYYEEAPVVHKELSVKNYGLIERSIEAVAARADTSRFKENVDVRKLLQIILWCAEGFMKEKSHMENMDIDILNQEFLEILESFRSYVYREE